MSYQARKDMQESYMHITKWRKPIWKGYILYNSNYVKFWIKQNYGDNKDISGCQGLWKERMNRQSMEDF